MVRRVTHVHLRLGEPDTHMNDIIDKCLGCAFSFVHSSQQQQQQQPNQYGQQQYQSQNQYGQQQYQPQSQYSQNLRQQNQYGGQQQQQFAQQQQTQYQQQQQPQYPPPTRIEMGAISSSSSSSDMAPFFSEVRSNSPSQGTWRNVKI